MTACDLLISMKNKAGAGKRNPVWVGRNTTKIYGNAGFMGGKSRSNLGRAKWPHSISVNLLSRTVWTLMAVMGFLFSAPGQCQPVSPSLALHTARQVGVPHLGDGAQSDSCPPVSPQPLSTASSLSAFALGFPAPGSNLRFPCNWQRVSAASGGQGCRGPQCPGTDATGTEVTGGD